MKKLITLSVIFVVTIGIILSAALFAWNYYYNHVNSKSLNWTEQYFILKEDTSFSNCAEQLYSKSLITSEEALTHYAKTYKLQTDFKKGNYIISARTNLKDLILKLQSGKSDFEVVTIPEGYSLYQIGTTLEKRNLLKRDDLLSTKQGEFDKEGLLKQANDVIYPLEGYLFPATYNIRINTTKAEVVSMMYKQFLTVFGEKSRDKASKLGYSINEIMTIASIIEKEASTDADRAKIAGVLYNRLKINMPIQSDATVIYAKKLGNGNISVVTYKDLEIDSKYNTYKSTELPPGPICAPGAKSIEAALNPEKNSYLYFFLGKSGMVYSATYQGHLNNIAKYSK